MSSYPSIQNLNHNHHLPLPLPLPLKSIPINNNLSQNNDNLPVTLPPINGNYIHTLTENNLTHFATTTLAHHRLAASKVPSSSSPPSLTSSTSSTTSVSPVSSPDLSSAHLHQPTAAYAAAQPKRRQRLGPSCDSCRSRKVKCNAEIVVLSRFFDPAKDLLEFSLSSTQHDDLVASNRCIKLNEEFNLIVSNAKLIKFKPCESCRAKSIACCFSKGYTKEDIMLNNKKSTPGSATGSSSESDDAGASPVKVEARKYKSLSLMISPTVGHNDYKITKAKKDITVTSPTLLGTLLSPKKPTASEFNSRKSSCGSCRRRKVKCVFNPALNKCEGCVKKGHDCSFETK